MKNFVPFLFVVALFYAAAYGLSWLFGTAFDSAVLYLLVGLVISEFVDRVSEGR